jgi:hypothetical protein
MKTVHSEYFIFSHFLSPKRTPRLKINTPKFFLLNVLCATNINEHIIGRSFVSVLPSEVTQRMPIKFGSGSLREFNCGPPQSNTYTHSQNRGSLYNNQNASFIRNIFMRCIPNDMKVKLTAMRQPHVQELHITNETFKIAKNDFVNMRTPFGVQLPTLRCI